MTPTQTYRVLTWDTDEQEFTPQVGVPEGPYTLFGLRGAIRQLRDLGYSCHRQDSFVRVEAAPAAGVQS